MNRDALCFFDKSPLAIPLYEEFEQRVLSGIDDVSIRIQKTQIAFSKKYNFAFVSFLPVHKAKERPSTYIVVTFGLGYKKQSSRIDIATEPYKNRWTHHILISNLDEIDDELMSWVKEASEFSAGKR